jgi:hypothetical protein
MAYRRTAAHENVKLAKRRWGRLTSTALTTLRELTRHYRLSVALGDLLYLDQRWYVSHAGLLDVSRILTAKVGAQGLFEGAAE